MPFVGIPVNIVRKPNFNRMQKETLSQAIAHSPALLVDFYATWCGPCQTMHPVLEQLKQQMGDRLRIVKIDVDENKHAAAAYGIRSVPTLLLFVGGEQRWRSAGAMPLAALKARVEEELAK